MEGNEEEAGDEFKGSLFDCGQQLCLVTQRNTCAVPVRVLTTIRVGERCELGQKVASRTYGRRMIVKTV